MKHCYKQTLEFYKLNKILWVFVTTHIAIWEGKEKFFVLILLLHSLAKETTCLAARTVIKVTIVAAVYILQSTIHICKISHTSSDQ